jgi:hypothetical protein
MPEAVHCCAVNWFYRSLEHLLHGQQVGHGEDRLVRHAALTGGDAVVDRL